MKSCPVCILTAGKGSRMMGLTQFLNKALLPINNQAIISKIIEKFPDNTEFVIGLGYMGQQVRNYLEIAHPNIAFSFVEIDNYEGAGSGPGHSLLCCSEKLMRPFYLVTCDTLWSSDIDLTLQTDWFGVAKVPSDISHTYCNFEIQPDGRIVAIHDKTRVSGNQFRAFSGLAFVYNYSLFWEGLKSTTLIAGEHQLSNGIHKLVQNKKAYIQEIDWQDVGNSSQYQAVIKSDDKFDFGKENEAFYIYNNNVIKYFADHSISKNRVQRAALKSTVFPSIQTCKGGFYSYKYVNGKTLYELCTPTIFSKLLRWLDSNLWQRINIAEASVELHCAEFYQTKSLNRIHDLQKRYSLQEKDYVINGNTVPPCSELLAEVPWNLLSKGVPVFFHGDLQFDNILYNHDTDSFTLIDWRQDFAGATEFGDLYYDIAKLLGGLWLNYDLVKRNLFTILENGTTIHIDFASRYHMQNYEAILKKFIEKKGLSWQKVKIITALIYMNMSPLHHAPFDKFIYYMGLLNLKRELDNYSQSNISASYTTIEIIKGIDLDAPPFQSSDSQDNQ